MDSGTASYKRIKCDTCGEASLTSVAKLDSSEYAMAVPPDWRLIWNGQKLKFRCDGCWTAFDALLDQQVSPAE